MRVMGEGRWRAVLSKVRSQLAVGADGFPAYMLKLASPEVQGVYLDGLKDVDTSLAHFPQNRPTFSYTYDELVGLRY